jgi:hypothetical protein
MRLKIPTSTEPGNKRNVPDDIVKYRIKTKFATSRQAIENMGDADPPLQRILRISTNAQKCIVAN